MDEEKREARRKALAQAELDRAWDTPKPSVAAEPVQAPTAEMRAVLDAAADRLVESLNPPPVSVPSMDALDSAWEDQEEDEDDEEEEEPEPELPDENLDPVAYAAATKARDERMEARRERKRVKGEAKKARRKARMDAAKSKQKGKTKKARPPAVAQAAKVAKAAARAELIAKRVKSGPRPEADDTDTDDTADATMPARARAKAPPSRLIKKPMLSSTNTWMLGIALLVFIAAAIFVAVITRSP